MKRSSRPHGVAALGVACLMGTAARGQPPSASEPARASQAAHSGKAAQATEAAPASEPVLVEVTSVIPDALLDLRYATENNFLKKKLYPDGARCLLLKETADKLAVAAASLRSRGYRLRLFDCYRPRSVQWEMWKMLPKPGYVADPRFGSNHNRGAAVDLTLAMREGGAVEMPTDFDFFGPAAGHRYGGGTARSRKHRAVLLEAMSAAGFKPNRMEWWHYDLPDARGRPVLDLDMTAPGAREAPASK